MTKENTPFDEWLMRRGVQTQTSVANTAPHVRDMLEGAWKAAQSVFGKQAKPEHALTLLPLLLDAAAAERRLLQDEGAAQTTGDTTRSPSNRQAPRKGR